MDKKKTGIRCYMKYDILIPKLCEATPSVETLLESCRVWCLTGKRPILSCRSSTSFTSRHIFLLVGACHAPASTSRPGRQGRTLLANCRQSGHVNSPLSTENPWRTWSFWAGENKTKHECQHFLLFWDKDWFLHSSLPSEIPCTTCGSQHAECVHRSGHRRLRPSL